MILFIEIYTSKFSFFFMSARSRDEMKEMEKEMEVIRNHIMTQVSNILISK